MADDVKTYQPGWGEKKRHHHHHHHSYDAEQNRGLGGALRMKDKQAYYGLMFVLIVVLLFGAYMLLMLFVNEWRAMPKDDPTTEMSVDELRIHKVAQQDALLVGDSLSSDIRGARNAGIRSCWFNPHGAPPRADIPADFEIRTLAELPPLLERLFPEELALQNF